MFDMFRDKARRDLVKEIKKEVEHDMGIEHEDYIPDGVVNLDHHREIEALVKSRLGAHHVIMCAQMIDGTVMTYIPEEIGDKDLVYLIQTLQDLRDERLTE